jgi:hypothetical protein
MEKVKKHLEDLKTLSALKPDDYALEGGNRHCQVFSVNSHQGFILNGFHKSDYAAIL